MRPFDAYALYEFARIQASVPGDMVEVGMYRGGSAKIICSVKGDKIFYGFDTFEGLPDVGQPDTHWGARWFHKAQFKVNMETVGTYLNDFPRVVLTKGLFPESGSVLDGKHLSFVNLDVDLYKSTIESLNFLWDKMSDRGVILIHDTHTDGVKRTIKEFLADRKAVWLGCGCSQLALSRAP